MLTLGAVSGQFQALYNGGLEILLRIWHPLCGGIFLEGNMVGIRFTVSLRLRVRMALRDSVEFRFKAWPGFGCISVGIRDLGSVLVVPDVPIAVGAPVLVGELVAVWRPALEFEVHPVMRYF